MSCWKSLLSVMILCITVTSAYAKDTVDPRYPQRKYRKFLLQNQLKVLLISDPSINHSAASLSVDVGSLSDPKDAMGMAHFLEHMLFLGTEKYPEVGSYQKFVHSHDGYSNAYTATDHTNYHFEIASDYFEQALDRFSRFFIDPTLNSDLIEREKNAVASEHAKNKTNDYWRVRQLQRSHYNTKHVANSFATGNLDTLKNVTRERLLKFYKDYYSSERMALVVISKENLDTLQAWVNQKFSPIPNRGLKALSYSDELIEKKKVLRELHVVPVKDKRSLNVLFPLPPSEHLYRTRPLGLLSFIIGHEGEGSLLSWLKKQDLATGLSAGRHESTHYFSGFSISIELTSKGLEEYQRVLAAVFQYLQLLRKSRLPQHIFEDVKQMAQIDYQFAEKPQGADYVTTLASLLHRIPLSKVERYQVLLDTYDPKQFDNMLFRLTPENMLVTLIAQGLSTDQVEPYYGTSYRYKESSLGSLTKLYINKSNSALKVPRKNPFIPENLGVLAPQSGFELRYQSRVGLAQDGVASEVLKWLEKQPLSQAWTNWEEFRSMLPELTEIDFAKLQELVGKHQFLDPQLIMDGEQAKVWFQQDLRFRTPKAGIQVLIHSPEVYASPRHAVLSQLYVDALKEVLNEFRYEVSMAGLSFGMRSGKKGIFLNIGGYSDRSLELLKELATKLKSLPIDKTRFITLKEKKLREYRNFEYNRPYHQGLYLKRLLLEHQKYSLKQYESEILEIELPDLLKHVQTLYEHNAVEALVYGNLKKENVQQAFTFFTKELGGKVFQSKERFQEQIIFLSPVATYAYQHGLKVDNSALLWNIQVANDDLKLRSALLVISRALRPDFYTEMRTKQQLGYIVDAGMTEMEKTHGFLFLIQSGDYNPGILAERVRSYVPGFIERFRQLTPEAFEGLKQAVISAKLEKAKSVYGESSKLFELFLKKNLPFDYQSDAIKAVERLTLKEVVEVAEKFLDLNKQRNLLIQLQAKQHSTEKKNSEQVLLIKSIDNFKEKQTQLYPQVTQSLSP